MERYVLVDMSEQGTSEMVLNPFGAWVRFTDAQQTVERLERELMEWKRALHSLTPGGSEYANDSKACVEWVREARSRQHEAIVDGVKQRNDLKQQVAQLREERDKLFEAEVELNARQFCEFAHEIALPGTRLPASPSDMISWGKFKEVVEALATAHTTLRGLVEQLPVAGLPVEHSRPDDFIVMKDGEGWLAYTYNYWAKFATEDEAKAYAALLQYRATLPREGGAQEVL